LRAGGVGRDQGVEGLGDLGGAGPQGRALAEHFLDQLVERWLDGRLEREVARASARSAQGQRKVSARSRKVSAGA